MVQSDKPFRHIIIDDFLDGETLRKIVETFDSLKFERKDSDLFNLEQTDDLTNTDIQILKDVQKKILDVSEIKSFFEMVPKSVDMSGMLYKDSDYLLCHDDRLEGRSIAYILYLNTMRKEEGGALKLINSKDFKTEELILPKENRLVMFEVSEKSWHEVSEIINAKRKSLGGWLHC